jgi:hypothetical protein
MAHCALAPCAGQECQDSGAAGAAGIAAADVVAGPVDSEPPDAPRELQAAASVIAVLTATALAVTRRDRDRRPGRPGERSGMAAILPDREAGAADRHPG